MFHGNIDVYITPFRLLSVLVLGVIAGAWHCNIRNLCGCLASCKQMIVRYREPVSDIECIPLVQA